MNRSRAHWRIRQTARRTAVSVVTATLLASSGPALEREGAQTAPSHVVVLELFTSQGCSTCPPADRLLTELGDNAAGRLVPLAFHVDFWNRGGWKDPFSCAAWTQRQIAYAKRFGLQQIYTPQAVVDGDLEMIGSRAQEVRGAMAVAAARPAGTLTLRLDPSASDVGVQIDIELPEEMRGRPWDLMAAIYETGVVTAVSRGENSGLTLLNDYVVRSLRSVGRVKEPSRHAARLPLEKSWNRTHLGVAVFLQDPTTLQIRGANAEKLGVRGN